MADPMEAAAIREAVTPADGVPGNLAPTTRASLQPRASNEAPASLSGSGGNLAESDPEPEALRLLARALIDLAVSMLAEDHGEERKEKAA